MWLRAELIVRVVIGWAFTLLMSALASLFLLIGRPVLGWKVFLKPWAKGTLRIIRTRIEIDGAERLKGPAIFVSNHQSTLDGVFMPAVLPTTTRFVAKKELGKVPLWGWILAYGGGVMVDRANPRAAIQSIKDGVAALPEGWSVCVFPEGTRSRDGRLLPLKKGAFHIAMASRMPIVPIAMQGAYDLMPKYALLPRPGTIYVTVGEPISTEHWCQETLQEHQQEVFRAMSMCLARSHRRWERAREGVPFDDDALNPEGGYGHSAGDVHST